MRTAIWCGIALAAIAAVATGVFFLTVRNDPAGLPSVNQVTGTARLSAGIGELDGSIFDENYIDSNITPGMSIRDVEAILGKPYLMIPFMGMERASYKIVPPPSGPRPLMGIGVVYGSGKVKHVNKSFGM